MPSNPTPATTRDDDRAFLGHPRGLRYLAFCEFWERFSYYGMQTLLVLYMTRQLLINAAVIISPLVTGTLGEKVAWHYGFGVAGIGMVIGLVIYLAGRKWLPVETRAAQPDTAGPKSALSRAERATVLVLVLVLPVLAVGSIGNQQLFNAYMLWVPEHVSLVFFGQTMPTTWLMTLDAVVSVSFLLGAVAFWRLWAKRFPEPSEAVKITIGLAFSAVGVLCLVGAAMVSASGEKAGIGWVLGFEFFNSMGFANVFPVGMALYARVSPQPVAGTMIGVYMLHLFLANNLVGWLGGLLDHMTGASFWLLHAGLIGAAAIIMLLLSRFAGHLLNPTGSGKT